MLNHLKLGVKHRGQKDYLCMVQLLLLLTKILSIVEKEVLVILVGKCTILVRLYVLSRFSN